MTTELVTKSWERFAVAETKRMSKEFEVLLNGSLQALEQTLHRLDAVVDPHKVAHVDVRTMIVQMVECFV